MSESEREAAVQVLAMILAALAGGAILSTLYLWAVYLRSAIRARLFLVMAVASGLITAGAGAVLWPVVLVLRDEPRLEGVTGTFLVVAGLGLAFVANMVLAGYVFLLRRSATRAGSTEARNKLEDAKFGRERRALEGQHIEEAIIAEAEEEANGD